MCIVQVSCLCKSSTKKLLCAFVRIRIYCICCELLRKNGLLYMLCRLCYINNDAYQYSTGFSSFCQEEDGYNAESDLEVRGGCSGHNYSIIYV